MGSVYKPYFIYLDLNTLLLLLGDSSFAQELRAITLMINESLKKFSKHMARFLEIKSKCILNSVPYLRECHLS